MGVPEDPQRLFRYIDEHRPDCPKCGYSLAGLRVRNCPECGEALSVAAFLRKKHRRSNLPEWLHAMTTVAATCAFGLVFSCLLPWGAWVTLTMASVVLLYLVVFVGWYVWAHRR